MNRRKLLSTATKIILALLIVSAVLLIVFLIGRYGWKLQGFHACESAGIERVTVTNGLVEITGFAPSSFPSGFLGYHAEETDGKLYVGFRFSRIFGFFETGDFQIRIPTQGKITQVYIKTGQTEHLIWSEEEGP